jgi:mannose-6-phosphate isomerase-like protein (cupin superfamily)
MSDGNGRRVANFSTKVGDRLYDRIIAQRVPGEKRILKAADIVWEGNIKHLLDVQHGFANRALSCFIRRLAPGATAQIHRHNFEAIGLVLKGEGFDIHDGERIDWAEGDVLFIPPNVWHQHGNTSATEEAHLLLITDWPLLLHLGVCTEEEAPTWEEALSRPTVYPDPYPVD